MFNETKKENLRVTGWTDWYFKAEQLKTIEPIPLNMFQDVLPVISKEIRSRGYKFSGYRHQNHENCVPVINDKYYVQCSMRGWGAVMAEAYFGEEDENEPSGTYMVWAWTKPQNESEVFPGQNGELEIDKNGEFFRYKGIV